MSSQREPERSLRPELGDFSSIVCFKAAIAGIEDALGEKAAAIALMAAGRKRGKALATHYGLRERSCSTEELCALLNRVLGAEGTRLCIVDRIECEGEGLTVHCRETVCSAGESEGSGRMLSYTAGALQGVMELYEGRRLRSRQTASVLRGATHDVLEFCPL